MRLPCTLEIPWGLPSQKHNNILYTDNSIVPSLFHENIFGLQGNAVYKPILKWRHGPTFSKGCIILVFIVKYSFNTYSMIYDLSWITIFGVTSGGIRQSFSWVAQSSNENYWRITSQVIHGKSYFFISYMLLLVIHGDISENSHRSNTMLLLFTMGQSICYYNVTDTHILWHHLDPLSPERF